MGAQIDVRNFGFGKFSFELSDIELLLYAAFFGKRSVNN